MKPAFPQKPGPAFVLARLADLSSHNHDLQVTWPVEPPKMGCRKLSWETSEKQCMKLSHWIVPSMENWG